MIRNRAISKTERLSLHNRCALLLSSCREQSVIRKMFDNWFGASGSVAGNWIEADEALSKKDFLMRVKICRKESKESRLFLRLIDTGLTKTIHATREALAAEARELTLIFSAIITKSGGS
jgi:four helix bundle protein